MKFFLLFPTSIVSFLNFNRIAVVVKNACTFSSRRIHHHMLKALKKSISPTDPSFCSLFSPVTTNWLVALYTSDTQSVCEGEGLAESSVWNLSLSSQVGLVSECRVLLPSLTHSSLITHWRQFHLLYLMPLHQCVYKLIPKVCLMLISVSFMVSPRLSVRDVNSIPARVRVPG